jgi:hypothetical protein
MRFFMAESGYAMGILLQSPYASATVPDGSGLTYGQEVTNLLPKIKLAVDYMMSLATQNTHDSLYGDLEAPNRELSDANAFMWSWYLLQNYAPAASSLAGYASEFNWWLNNIYVQNYYFPYRASVNTSLGVYYEGDSMNGYDYDSSYAGVGVNQAMRMGYYFPTYLQAVGVNVTTFLKLSGRFVQQRIFYPTDPTGVNTTPFVDDTDDTRTGPIPDPETGKSADFDMLSAQSAMLWYTALYNRPEGVLSVSSTGSYSLLVSRPPVIFNDPDWMTLTLTKGTAMTAWNAYATNTGIQNGTAQTLDPAFVITETGIPPGLSLSGPSTWNPSLKLDSGLAWYTLSGTPTTPGTYNVVLTPANRNGTGAAVTLAITVGPVPMMTFSIANHTYGDAAFTASASSNSNAPITYSVVSGPATVSGSTVSITGAGTVVLQASQPANSNYANASSTATFTVAPAVLQVGLSGSPTRIYGTVNPALTAALMGFVNGDTQASAVTGAPIVSTNAVPKSPAGSYTVTVTQGTLTAANYTFNVTNGTLTVTGGAAQAIVFEPVTVTAPGSSVALAAQATSGLTVTLAVTSGPATVSGNTLTVNGHGAVTVQATQPGDGDFAAAAPVSQTFTAP